MVWKQLLVASAIAACSSRGASALMIDGCPDGTYPVSVLDDPQIHCLSGRPCSGSYSVAGIPQGVGACPSNTGCALLPHNEAIMGCVPAGRADVAYVNADGSLTRGGKTVSLQQTVGSNTATNTNTNANTDSTNAAATTTTTTTTNNNANNAIANNNANGASAVEATKNTNSNANNNNASGATAASSAPAAASSSAPAAPAAASTSSPTVAATVAPPSDLDGASAGSGKKDPSTGSGAGLRGSKAGSGDAVPSPSPTPAETPSATPTPTPTPEQTSQVTAQQTLADIDGDSKTNAGESARSGVNIFSIIGIAVGCVAVVAVVAGVRLLKKGKEPVVETPEGALDDYGGGITPKENVVLL